MGAVIHTLNPRLHRDELSFIVNDAEDRAIIVDESLLEVFETFHDARDFEHVIVVRRSGDDLPDGYLDYEALIAGAEPMQWPADDERRAAAMCYTSGTTGRPKGVVYSHRSLVLHSLVAALPDVKDVSRQRHAAAGRADVPRQRVGADLHRRAGRRRARAARPQARRRVACSTCWPHERVTITAGVPTVWMAVLAGDRRRARPLGPQRAAPHGRRRLGRAAEHAQGL